MAISLINIGQLANDGTGDELRDAFIKVNQNFDELDSRVIQPTTAVNIGEGLGIYAQTVNGALQFKTLIAGTGVSIAATTSTMTINAAYNLRINSDDGLINLGNNGAIRVTGNNSISTSIADNQLIIDNSFSQLSDDNTPGLGGNLNARQHDIRNVNTIVATTLDLGKSFEFGVLGKSIDNILDWITYSTDIDLGSFAQPSSFLIDMGSI